LECATFWPATWHLIQLAIDSNIQQQMDRHYKHLNKKLDQLLTKQPKRSTHLQHDDDCHFHARVKNPTNIRFDQEEMQLLKYGLNYSIEKPASTYTSNLIAVGYKNAEYILHQTPPPPKKKKRKQNKTKLKQIIGSTSRTKVLEKRQLYVTKALNKKLATENAKITQADKGKTIIIINSKEYSDKVLSFLTANNFKTLTKDPTEKFHKLVHKTMQECNLIIDKRQIRHLMQKKAAPPNLKAQLKLHKTSIPIRPVINNRTAPAEMLAKNLTNILDQYITLHNKYVVTNSINLAHYLTKLEIHKNHRLITFGIKIYMSTYP
jgi:hypothetical protein